MFVTEMKSDTVGVKFISRTRPFAQREVNEKRMREPKEYLSLKRSAS